jgi:uncharacterized protein (DUF924 family)
MNINKADEILEYWFPINNEANYDKWFMKSQNYDEEIKEKFKKILDESEKGKGFEWLMNKNSFVAHIILMDQFSRHIYRNNGDSFKNDKGVLIFTELGIDIYMNDLQGYELMFAFMPYMHTELITYQVKGLKIYEKMVGIQKYKLMNPNLNQKSIEYLNNNIKILNDMKNYIDLHHDVIKRFGRFPKRNHLLNRESTPEELDYILNEAKDRPF